MIKNNLILFSILFILFSCKNDNTKESLSKNNFTVDQIKEVAIEYLIKDGQLEKDPDPKKYKTAIVIYDLINNKAIRNSDDGVYRLGITKSHSNEYALFKNKEDIVIINASDFSSCMIELFRFLENHNIESTNRDVYIKKMVVFCKTNDPSLYRKVIPK